MNKFISILQIIASAALALMVLATLINLFFITQRPETISVVNVLIGQGVLITCLLVLSRVLFRKGIAGLRQRESSSDSESAS